MTLSDFERAANFIRKSVAVDSEVGPMQGVQLVEALNRRIHEKSRTRRLTAGAGGALLVVGAMFVVMRQHQPRDLTYQVGTSKELGVVGNYVSAPKGNSLNLHFSEGSQVVLEPRARIRVTGTTSHGAVMILEDGRARADIVHHNGADWRILAGPYVVGVTGTSFDVDYNVGTQTFELEMHSGVVKVFGPGLGSPVEVRDTQRFVLSANAAERAQESSGVSAHQQADPDVDSTHSPKVDASVADAVLGPTKPIGSKFVASHVGSASVATTANSATSESWARLGARGQHRRIVELAEQQGLESATATASGPDLLALGNAARFAGKLGLAVKAYRAVRDRFSNSEEASGAAFFLGRLSESSDPARAMDWYERYVAEAPTGAWVADALGRHLVLLNSTKGTASAQAAAKDYLERFPNGPYAGFARKIVGP